MSSWHMTYGASVVSGEGIRFRVWAPNVQEVAVKIEGRPDRLAPMIRMGEDFEAMMPDAAAGDRYWFVLNGEKERPDPVSRSQPRGVHGPSEIIAQDSFAWLDREWRGLDLKEYIFYEIHTGTFTREGTFDGVATKIPHLKELGITAIELMPVAEFPGCRNWGYDGVDLYAPHSAYGGPSGLKRLVDACHTAELAVVLDVVYNHLGPEGNYLAEFGPYFTDRYQSPWGAAINFDGPRSDDVRRFFIENALYWLTEYHIDALRLDAIHGIFDFGALHILREIRERFLKQAERLGRKAYLIAESDLNDVRIIRPPAQGGYGLDAQWHDEFHHSVVGALTGSARGFFADFGELAKIGKAMTQGFVYDGVYSPHRQRRFGSSSKDEEGRRFVAFIQNHDQIANTGNGFRLCEIASFELQKLTAALLLCSPYLPLIFMGEEFGERAPFLYFTSHSDEGIARSVSDGRRREFADLMEPEEFLDPQAPGTFHKSKIHWERLNQTPHRAVLCLYRDLIVFRKSWQCLSNCRKDLTRVDVDEQKGSLSVERGDPSGKRALLLCNFSAESADFSRDHDAQAWRPVLSTASSKYGGSLIWHPQSNGGDLRVPGESAALYAPA